MKFTEMIQHGSHPAKPLQKRKETFGFPIFPMKDYRKMKLERTSMAILKHF